MSRRVKPSGFIDMSAWQDCRELYDGLSAGDPTSISLCRVIETPPRLEPRQQAWPCFQRGGVWLEASLAPNLLLPFPAAAGITAAQQLTGQSEWVHGDPEGLRGLKAAGEPPGQRTSSAGMCHSCSTNSFRTAAQHAPIRTCSRWLCTTVQSHLYSMALY